MPRKIQPYWQGDLDSLCGIHAIINALYALFPDMKEREAERLFRSLLEEVARKRSNPLQIVWRGMDPPLFRHLLSFAANSVALKRSIAIEVSRPFSASRSTLNEMLKTVGEHVSDGGVPIIFIRGKSSHWTLVSKVTQKKLHLFDSVGRDRIRIRQCSFRQGKRYRIHAAETMFLRKLKERR